MHRVLEIALIVDATTELSVPRTLDVHGGRLTRPPLGVCERPLELLSRLLAALVTAPVLVVLHAVLELLDDQVPTVWQLEREVRDVLLAAARAADDEQEGGQQHELDVHCTTFRLCLPSEAGFWM